MATGVKKYPVCGMAFDVRVQNVLEKKASPTDRGVASGVKKTRSDRPRCGWPLELLNSVWHLVGFNLRLICLVKPALSFLSLLAVHELHGRSNYATYSAILTPSKKVY